MLFIQSMEEIIEIDYQGLPLRIAARFRKGNRGALLFVHGLGCSKDTFKDVWISPGFENYSILTFDLVGFGTSSKRKEFSYSMEDHADVCTLVIKKLNLDTIHLVAHSMGGAIGLLLIEKLPERFVSFANVEGNLIGEDCAMLSRKTIRVRYEEFEEFLSQMKKEIGKAKDTSQVLHKWLCQSDPYGFYCSAKSLVEWSDSRRLLNLFVNLNMKKVYIYGDENSEADILKLIRGKIKTIPILNSGHFMMLDNPHEFYSSLKEFLEISSL
ncbi:MAG: hypothetical protein AYK19_01235 [Theionarchaea archaeon DG-70-1]|nr:MAG: hypothetical protein AYK19_01235 [Theionarchaea archaeon DG-70-1]